MKYTDFMHELQNYYGLYPEGSQVPNYVLGYLQRDIDETKLDRLFRFVTYSHPHRFGAPGIAEIEKSISDAIYKKKGDDVHSSNFRPYESERPNTQKEDIAIGELMKKHGLSDALRKHMKSRQNKT